MLKDTLSKWKKIKLNITSLKLTKKISIFLPIILLIAILSQCSNPDVEEREVKNKGILAKESLEDLNLNSALPKVVKTSKDNLPNSQKIELGKLLFSIQFYRVIKILLVQFVTILKMVMLNIAIDL